MDDLGKTMLLAPDDTVFMRNAAFLPTSYNVETKLGLEQLTIRSFKLFFNMLLQSLFTDLQA